MKKELTQNKKTKKELIRASQVLWIIAITTFAFLLVGVIYSLFIEHDMKTFFKLLVPFGVLISACLASITVMRNINNTNIIEEEKAEAQVKNIQKYLDYIIASTHHELETSMSLYDSFIASPLRGIQSREIDIFNIKSFNREIQDEVVNCLFEKDKNDNLMKHFILKIEESKIIFTGLLEKIKDKEIIFYENKENIFTLEQLTSYQIRNIERLIHSYHSTLNRMTAGTTDDYITFLNEDLLHFTDSIRDFKFKLTRIYPEKVFDSSPY